MARPTVDPRLRQRWVDTRRQQGRHRLRLVTAAAATVFVALVAFVVVHSPVLRVRHVRVVGVGQAGLGLISARAGLDREVLMVNIDAGRLSRTIEAIPWVASARVVRLWPGTVDITVTHRTAVGEVPVAGGGTALVDASGRVLALRGGHPAGLPVLTTLVAAGTTRTTGTTGTGTAGTGTLGTGTLGTVTPGSWVPGTPGAPGPPRASSVEALQAAAALPGSVSGRVASVSVVGGQVHLQVGTTTVVLGPATSLGQKMTSLRTIIDEVDLSGVALVDLRVPDRPALTPSAPSGTVSTTSGG